MEENESLPVMVEKCIRDSKSLPEISYRVSLPDSVQFVQQKSNSCPACSSTNSILLSSPKKLKRQKVKENCPCL